MFDSRIMGSRACLHGMRIPVAFIAEQAAHGAMRAGIQDRYPDRLAENIREAFQYASRLTQKKAHCP